MSYSKQDYQEWLKRADASLQPELRAMDEASKEDAFYCELSFGTGGMRGLMGAGTAKLNVHTVARATQGLADFLHARGKEGPVVIARDSRHMGKEFVETTAGVLAANGIKALVFPRIQPTPVLSFAVRSLGAAAGVVITASHNPKDYNGYKVYNARGCQITTGAAAEIQTAIRAVPMFDGAKQMAFAEGVDLGMVEYIDDALIERFVESCAAVVPTHTDSDLKVVYTPLHGTGGEAVSMVLDRMGVSYKLEPEQAKPNGDFPTCPYPNPEEREALTRGLEFCKQEGSDLLLASDPDADRVGVAVLKDGEPVLLTGNEVGILLLDYLCQAALAKGEDLSKKVVVSTIVSSAMADALAAKYGFELRRTLTGFKFVAEQLDLLDAQGRKEDFLFGFEESYGYLGGTHVRDKDAVSSVALICEMARAHAAQGKSLLDAMGELYEKYGYYANGLVSVSYPGSDGAQKMQELVAGLRKNPPVQVAGFDVLDVVDYAPGVPMPVVGASSDQVLPPSNVLEFKCVGGFKLLVRPSGTEPKVKAYTFVRSHSKEDTARLLGQFERSARQLLEGGQ